MIGATTWTSSGSTSRRTRPSSAAPSRSSSPKPSVSDAVAILRVLRSGTKCITGCASPTARSSPPPRCRTDTSRSQVAGQGDRPDRRGRLRLRIEIDRCLRRSTSARGGRSSSRSKRRIGESDPASTGRAWMRCVRSSPTSTRRSRHSRPAGNSKSIDLEISPPRKRSNVFGPMPSGPNAMAISRAGRVAVRTPARTRVASRPGAGTTEKLHAEGRMLSEEVTEETSPRWSPAGRASRWRN